jgi:hypothetical protein
MTSKRSPLAYKRPDSEMTLGDGLAEYYAQIPELTNPSHLPPEEAAFFRAHDATHVVFGCDISPVEELWIGAWTWAGTSATLRDILRYARSREVSRIRREFGYLQGMRLFLRELPRLLRIIRLAQRMSRRWPLLGHEAYLQRPLREIRAEFNIDIR